jgi:hypothetical protein
MGGDDLGDDSLFVADVIDESNGGSVDDDDDEKEPAKKRSKRQLSPEEILVETGRRLAELEPTEQATFLNTAIRHFALLKEKSSKDKADDDSADNGGGGASDEILQAQWLLRKKSNDGNMLDEIRNVVSLKKLKHWKGTSPCVVCRVDASRINYSCTNGLFMFISSRADS